MLTIAEAGAQYNRKSSSSTRVVAIGLESHTVNLPFPDKNEVWETFEDENNQYCLRTIELKRLVRNERRNV